MTTLNPGAFKWIGGAFVVTVLCAVAVVPLLRVSSPCTHDGSAHYYRVVALRETLEGGVPFARFLPDLALGYGYPFFNYRAASPYYLILGLHLAGLGLPLAQNVAYALCIVGSAITMYILARDLFGWPAGLVAGVAYAYAPYQFLDALLRGNIPESVAFFLMPLILWAFRRLALTGGRGWFLVSVISLSSLYVTHNISSLLFTPLLLAFIVVLAITYRERFPWLMVGAAFFLALGLSAFFWAPALLERDYVQLHMSYSTRNNDFRQNFIGLGEILAPPDGVDTSLMNPPIRVHLGLAQVILAVAGLFSGIAQWRDGEQRGQVVMSALAAGVMVWMSTPTSRFLWESLPLLRFVQFPWRLIGRAGLPVALLAGAFASVVTERISTSEIIPLSSSGVGASDIVLSLVVAVLILASLPYSYPPLGYCSRGAHPTIEDLFAYEHQNERLGLAASGSFFPVWVKKRPTESPLVEQYRHDSPVERFDETRLPPGARVVEAHYGFNSASVTVQSPERFHARYLSFYFPGWRVWIDGERVDITPSDPEGLITFEVPRGQHTVRVGFGETKLRLAADGISLLALIALGVLTVWSPGPEFERLLAPESLSTRSMIPLAVLGLSLLAFRLGIVNQVHTPFRRPELRPDGSLPGVEHSLERAFADGLKLIGYDQSANEIPADGTLRVDLYWTAYGRPTERYQTVVHLVDPNGLRWSLKDSFRPTDYQGAPPTTTWSPGRYALDSHEVEPLSATPPGTYDVVLTVFNRDTLAPLSALNEQGQPVAPGVVLGRVTLTSPRQPLSLEQLDTSDDVRASLGPMDLVGAELDQEEVAPGDPVLMTAFWRSEEAMDEDLELHLTLLASDGSNVATYDLSPTANWHPTSTWEPGRIWRGQHLLHLPADLKTGEYSWRFSISDSASHFVHPSAMRVVAPERTFEMPAVDETVDAHLGNVATLVGVARDPTPSVLNPGSTLTMTLVWRAEDETDVSYRVFVHLVGPHGELSAQSDGVPAEWARPTTGWLPGEYVEDVHHLTIPPDAPTGSYDLMTGMYVPRTAPGSGGERLTTPDGSDAVIVGTVTVERED